MIQRVIHNDVLKWAKTYDGPKFHALLCDPPYHLTSGNAVYDLAKTGAGNPRVRRKTAGGGFMGKEWDGGDIAYRPETWAALAKHLLPGAFGMAFASSRGWHRLACAIEDAGLVIHPSIFGWCYGSGFPKATRIDTQIDKAAGAKRKTREVPRNGGPGGQSDHIGQISAERKSGISPVSDPATPLARAWAGHRYGLQALKPALEPIIVFQKPYEGKPVECITETGAGALNIEGARIAGQPETTRFNPAKHGHEGWRMNATGRECAERAEQSQGRWPANFYLDEEAARRLGEQSGELGNNFRTSKANGKSSIWGSGQAQACGSISDTGTAARFFLNVDWQLEQADPVFYCAKASRKERDAGLDERNGHPTLKPLKLTQWLAALLLPPLEYAPRRILVPFAGSGSEMIGVALAGWEEIVGIEKEEEYVEIAEARLEYWTNKDEQLELI